MPALFHPAPLAQPLSRHHATWPVHRHPVPDRLPRLGCQRCRKVTGEQGTRGGYTQGELLLVTAGLGLLLVLFLDIAGSSSSARRAKRRGLRAARREVEGRVAELERENARLHKELETTQRTGALVGPRGASSEAP